jgi:protein associated with RNAse G/E
LDFKDERLNGQNELSYIYFGSSSEFNNNAIFWRIDGCSFLLNQTTRFSTAQHSYVSDGGAM